MTSLDGERKKLEIGFYKNVKDNTLLYFTGRYNEQEAPIFENEEKRGEEYFIYGHITGDLFKLNKKDINAEIKKSKEKRSWIEEKLKE